METVIADTSFAVALANRSDAKHEVGKAIYLVQIAFCHHQARSLLQQSEHP